MHRQIILSALILLLAQLCVFGQSQPIGWASFGAGVIGGAGGDTVTATTRNELAAYLGSTQTMVVFVEDTINLNPWERMTINANKSLIGKGFNATIRLGGFEVKGDNVVIQNLLITDSYDGDWGGTTHSTDAITIYGTNVWVDHCELSAGADGLLDIRADNGVAANFITVSNTLFRNHNKVSLIGSSDSETEDRNKLKTTFYHCWFDGTVGRGVNQRMPRTRFGDVHILNNYFEDVASYCSAARFESDLVVEGNFYRACNDMHFRDDVGLGNEDPELRAFGNFYELCSGRKESVGEAFDPGAFYGYTPDSVVDVPAIVMNSAGRFNNPDNVGPFAVTDTIDLDGSSGLKIFYVTANDTDPDGGTLRVARVIRTAVNYAQVRDNNVLYIAPHNQSFNDTIWYQLVDTQGGVDTGMVLVLSQFTGTETQYHDSPVITVVPNPADTQAWMTVSRIGFADAFSVEISDMRGDLIHDIADRGTAIHSKEEFRMLLRTDRLPTGTYVLTLRSADYAHAQLFTVIR